MSENTHFFDDREPGKASRDYIKTFTCKNFRNINVENLEFSKINLLIGPNCAGKSNFLRALSLASCIFDIDYRGKSSYQFVNIEEHVNCNNLLTTAIPDTELIEFGWNLHLNGSDAKYESKVKVSHSERTYDILQRPLAERKVQDFFTFCNVLGCSEIAQSHEDAYVYPQGFTLFRTAKIVSFNFRSWLSSETQELPQLIKFFNQFIPGVRNIYPDDNGVLRVDINGITYSIGDLSTGAAKALILGILLSIPERVHSTSLMIDDIDINLHPAWQKVIGNGVQTSSSFNQCFISTHSPDFLDSFTEGFKTGDVAIFVFNHGNPFSSIKKITYQDIAEELGDWELGDLYRTNDPAIDGWPW